MDDAAPDGSDGSDGESKGVWAHDTKVENKRQKITDEKTTDEKKKGNEDTTSASASSSAAPCHRRYTMIVAYDGTRFKGFQRQTSSSSSLTTTDPSTSGDKQVLRKNKVRRHDGATGKVLAVSVTVQELLEDALEMFAGPNWNRNLLKMRFAGRTDAGVHARGQVIAVTLPVGVVRKASVRSNNGLNGSSNNNGSNNNGSGKDDCDDDEDELWAIRRGINSRLPVDISIERVQVAPHHDFNPREEAQRKRYSYTLRYRRQVLSNRNETESMLPVCAQGGPHLLRSALDPMNGQCWIVPWPLDDSCLEDYCQVMTGTHDFSAFVHKSSRLDQLDNNRTVGRFDMERIQTVEEDGAAICTVRFTTEAKGFGRHQVRYMIGFLVDLCRGKGGALATDIRPGDNGERVADWLWNGDQDYDRLAAKIQKAAPCGLILEKVYF